MLKQNPGILALWEQEQNNAQISNVKREGKIAKVDGK